MTNVPSADAGNTLYPVLPLRDIVVFPHMIVPLFVGREKSIRALEEVMGSDRQIMLVTQINAGDDDPAPEAIYKVGTVANVLQLLLQVLSCGLVDPAVAAGIVREGTALENG